MRLHVRCPCSQCAKSGCKENTNVPNIHREVQGVKNVVYNAASSHNAGVHSPTHDTTQGVPGGGVKPIPEFLVQFLSIRTKEIAIATHIKAIIRKDLRRAAVWKEVQLRGSYT